MLVTFKSHASPNITTLENLAQYLLGIVGKQMGVRGAIGDDETDAAVKKLEAAIAEDKAVEQKQNEGKKSEERDENDRVRLAQRAYPLLNMLREAKNEGCAVTWETSER